MRNRKRGNEANQRDNGRIASILTRLWFFTPIFMLGLSGAIKNLQKGLSKGYNNMPVLNRKTFLANTYYNNTMQKGENSSFKLIILVA